ncbi:polysaccharide deacetylase family protein [Clostridium chauvoei]|nr:polysaccharide deacetylase family protein [Clostridium chauvoei]ATD54488.1 polysaccharide deacetylase [Clostridium chauvoei]ATD57829.1 polysaccharide deacetylase [Clostridium chauvoei]CDG01107.1 Putative Polysaccharide deacetylase [Clostridium chauvoei JF4335]SLK14551.1 Putative Polysaccharide deacetylase [Clostridium chauvoei JF4335]
MKAKTIFTAIFLICICAFAAFSFKDIIGNNLMVINKEETDNQAEENGQIIEDEEEKEENTEEIKEDKKEVIEYIELDPSEVYVPILMYHSIADLDPTNNLMVPTSQFEEQVKWLKENGFTSMLMGDVISSLKTGKVPKKPVAITFDDGYVDNYTNAYRILKKYDMKATFFIITDNTDKDPAYMSLNMLKEMKESGMAIESHTANHLELDKLSREDKVYSIRQAKDFLKNNLGIENKYLCYPVGKCDNETIEVAKELGIEGAVTTQNGFSNIKNGELQLKRVRISPIEIETFKGIFSEF